MDNLTFATFPRFIHELTGVSSFDIKSATDYHNTIAQRLIEGAITLSHDKVASVDLTLYKNTKKLPFIFYSDFATSTFHARYYQRIISINSIGTEMYITDSYKAQELLAGILYRSTSIQNKISIDHGIIDLKIYDSVYDEIMGTPSEVFSWRMVDGTLTPTHQHAQDLSLSSHKPGWNVEKRNFTKELKRIMKSTKD